MITTIVQFRLRDTLSADEVKSWFSQSGPRYQVVPGLVRKYYLISEDGRSAGAVYLWENRSDAERLFSEDFRHKLAEKYGSAPTIQYFETPVVVDNRAKEILSS